MDSALRALERAADPSPEGQARLWRARMRAETSTLDAGACPCKRRKHCSGHGVFVESCAFCNCPRCNGTGRQVLSWTERTALLAYCGVGWAREIVGCSKRCLPDAPMEACLSHAAECVVGRSFAGLHPWLQGLSRWGHLCRVRAALAAARVALRELECGCSYFDERGCWDCRNTGYDNAEDSLVEVAIDTVEWWLVDPSEVNWEVVEQLRCSLPVEMFVFVIYPLREALFPGKARGDRGRYWTSAIDDAVRIAGEEPVREAICEALVSWVTDSLASPSASLK